MAVRPSAMNHAVRRVQAHVSSRGTLKANAWYFAMLCILRHGFRSMMQCTMYEDKRLPDYEKLKAIAWQIRTKSAGSVAGFVLGSDMESTDTEADNPAEVDAPAATMDNS